MRERRDWLRRDSVTPPVGVTRTSWLLRSANGGLVGDLLLVIGRFAATRGPRLHFRTESRAWCRSWSGPIPAAGSGMTAAQVSAGSPYPRVAGRQAPTTSRPVFMAKSAAGPPQV